MMLTVEILFMPFVAGLLVLATHLPLGLEVVRRGVVFMDLAIAQFAILGAILIEMLLPNASINGLLAASVVASCIGVGLVLLVCQYATLYREAMLGSIYVFTAAVVLILISIDQGKVEHLTRMLTGDVLWIDSHSLLRLSIFTVLSWVLMGLFKRFKWQLGFYMAFALSVTYSVQLLGIYLVFATLIVPALVSFATSSTQWAWITGIIGYAAGLLTALWLDWPAGACIVVLLVLSAAIITLLQRVMLSRPDATSLKQPS